MVPRVDTALYRIEPPTFLGFVEPGRIRSHPQIILYIYNPNKPGTKTVPPGVDTAPYGMKPPIFLGFIEPAPPGEDKSPSPNQKLFHTCTTPTGDEKKMFSGSIPPRTVWKPQPGARKANATRGG